MLAGRSIAWKEERAHQNQNKTGREKERKEGKEKRQRKKGGNEKCKRK